MIQTIPRNLRPWIGATESPPNFVLNINFVFEGTEKHINILPKAPGFFGFLSTTAPSTSSSSFILSNGKLYWRFNKVKRVHCMLILLKYSRHLITIIVFAKLWLLLQPRAPLVYQDVIRSADKHQCYYEHQQRSAQEIWYFTHCERNDF